MKTYDELSDSTKRTYENFLGKMLDKGISISQVKRMTVKQYNRHFVEKGKKKMTEKSLPAKKRLLLQIQRYPEQVVSRYVDKKDIKNEKYKTFLYNEGYRLLNVKQEETKEIKKIKVGTKEYKKIDKEGKYGVVRLTNLNDNKQYYIKYNTKKMFNSHFNALIQKYEITNYKTEFLGAYKYKAYIEKEFKQGIVEVLS